MPTHVLDHPTHMPTMHIATYIAALSHAATHGKGSLDKQDRDKQRRNERKGGSKGKTKRKKVGGKWWRG